MSGAWDFSESFPQIFMLSSRWPTGLLSFVSMVEMDHDEATVSQAEAKVEVKRRSRILDSVSGLWEDGLKFENSC